MEPAQFCGQCGGRLAATEKFCIACGTPRRIEENRATNAPTAPLRAPDEPQTAKNITLPNAPTPTEATAVSPETLSGPNGLLTNGVVYVVAYLIVAIPTYVLPYFGSNSSVINALGAATGLGALPQFWFHLIALYLLVVIAWIRGGQTGRQWIAIFPVFAGIFDMVPGFSVIPMLPTIFHVLAVIIGVSGKLVAVDAPGAGKRRLVLSGVGFAVIAILAVVKTQAFLQHIEESPLRSNNTSTPSLRKPEPNRSASASAYPQPDPQEPSTPAIHDLKTATNSTGTAGTAKVDSLAASGTAASMSARPETCSALPAAKLLHGSVLNRTVNAMALITITFNQTGCSFTGNFAVSPPLYGSGPILGSLNRDQVQFVVPGRTNDIGRDLAFTGTVASSRISGGYLVDSGQVGTWQLDLQ